LGGEKDRFFPDHFFLTQNTGKSGLGTRLEGAIVVGNEVGKTNLGPYSVIFFFIPARTYFAIIKDLTIICMNTFLKSNL